MTESPEFKTFHSGPVTGGVLRGEKSRFQLFGDTVNTAARIESSGEANKITVWGNLPFALADGAESLQ